MADALISFRGVRKAFGPKVVYAGLDLEVMRGEVLTIVGGSGVGTSVMLKMLIGLLKPDRGSVTSRNNRGVHSPPVCRAPSRRSSSTDNSGAGEVEGSRA